LKDGLAPLVGAMSNCWVAHALSNKVKAIGAAKCLNMYKSSVLFKIILCIFIHYLVVICKKDGDLLKKAYTAGLLEWAQQ
jgi:hypothetical protein